MRVTLDPNVAAARDPRSPEAIRQRRGPDARLVPVAAAVWIAVAWTMVDRSGVPAVACAVVAAHAGGVIGVSNVRYWRGRGKARSQQEFTRRKIMHALCWQLVVCTVAAGTVAGMATVRIVHADQLAWLSSHSTQHFRGEVTIAGLPRLMDRGRVQVPVEVPGVGVVPLFVERDELRGLDGGETALQGDGGTTQETESGAAPHTQGETALNGDGGTTQETESGAAPHKPQSNRVRDKPLSTLLAPGKRVNISATVRRTDKALVLPLQLSSQRDVRPVEGGEPRGLWAIAQRLRWSLWTNISWLPDEIRRLVPGMVMGDVSMQTPAVRQEFVNTGLSHLSAVSGSNIAILASSVMVLATACGLRRRTRTVLTGMSICAFMAVVGPEPSVLRATVMGLIGVIAVATARWKDIVVALCISIIVLLSVDPNLAVNYGFVLSVVATAGIAVLAPRWSAATLRWWAGLTARHFHRFPQQWEAQFIRVLMVAIAADLVTIPVIAHMTGQLPVVTIVANVLVLWAVPLVTTVGLAVSVVGAIAPAVGIGSGVTKWFAIALVPPAQWIAWIASSFANGPKITVPESWPGAILTATIACIGVWSVRHPQRMGIRCAWPVAIVALVVMGRAGLVGVDQTKKPWTQQREVVADRSRTVVVPKEAQVIATFGVKPQVEAQSNEPPPPRSEVQPRMIVVEECGEPLGRPSFTASGIPVIYPCRNGTKVRWE
ncbi:ComEC/Rec2 family competence protein [Corynebacterium auriscanis]|uniref:ComEC/Rec2 family competence protein n=1 Tax=Corynebacterium auriscanis TaxID=99807 RepID=UPI0025B2994C|nr:ComEC/Rec2 family competence protein [Corynebacterium auriscanis]WJY72335.1 Competence protein [Corynebacterium auriscanis]